MFDHTGEKITMSRKKNEDGVESRLKHGDATRTVSMTTQYRALIN